MVEVKLSPSGRHINVASFVADPVAVQSLSDLPEPVGNVITLAANTRYEFVGDVDLGPNGLVAADGVQIVGPAARLSSTSGDLLSLPDGVSVIVDGVTFLPASDCIRLTGAASLQVSNCTFQGAGGNTAISLANPAAMTAGALLVVDCTFQGWSAAISMPAGVYGAIEVVGCTFAEAGVFTLIFGGTSIGRVVLQVNTFRVTGANTALRVVPGTTIPDAYAVGNVVTGGGISYDTNAAKAFSPIEVRTRSDLGASVATLVDGVAYRILQDIDLGAGAITAAQGNVLHGSGGKLLSTGAPVISHASGGDLTLEDLEIETSNAVGAVVAVAGGAQRLTLRGCRVTAVGGACVSCAGAPELIVDGCHLRNASGSGVRTSSGTTGWMLIRHSVFSGGDGVDLANAVTSIVVLGCLFDVPAAKTGIIDTSATAGRIVASVFLGAGSPTNPAPPIAGWRAYGNIGLADF